MAAESAGLESLGAAWILGFMQVESLKSNENWDPNVIAPSKPQ